MAGVEAVDKALGSLQVSKMKELKGTEKRDTLIAWEKKIQAVWKTEKLFEVDAPTIEEYPPDSISPADLREKVPKFFGTIAYPYMNGTLHAGHAFSISKVEFSAGVARMEGKRALFPLGFHCTGTPIKACADKLVQELEMFGDNFERYNPEEYGVGDAVAPPADKQAKEDVTKFTSKKTKVGQKSAGLKYQFQIMKSIGVPQEDIPKFADADHWLRYFPPLAERDLCDFGARIDWRRKFVTTDANPYYSAFIEWQMRHLKAMDKIKFGVRYTIYSIKDGQPCMDHDRSEGEGVTNQDYTALKLKVLEWAPKAQEAISSKLPAGANVFLVPATLRPETMYGQTCCFVAPKITYGVYRAKNDEHYIITERAARNMAYQRIFVEEGVLDKVADISGADLIGSLVNAPLSVHSSGVRVLPMESILPNKGTGVVTCVPSDSPDDYATVIDLAKKADYHKIRKEWAELEIVPIIDTPGYGNLIAKTLVEKMKINSPKDTKQLAEAKLEAYKQGFFSGKLVIGEFSGEKVETAKPKIREQLIQAGDAFAYAEPETKVTSRSGDDCIVALLPQFYLDYGEEKWLAETLDYLDNNLETWGDETRQSLRRSLLWLKAWSCAREYGLGTKLPWDNNFMVESLSDSSIYPAYYTVARFLHADLYGKEKGAGNISPEQMTDTVWDYVFTRRGLDDEVLASKIPKETLQSMRREFEFYYPFDMRSTGKDLAGNHLIFLLYNHVAIFPREYWPRGIRTNGFLLMNGEKMAKSTGNFMTLRDMVAKFGADASRIALADSGDGTNDGNLEEDVADSSILRLYNLRDHCTEMINDTEQRTGPQDSHLDALFENDMRALARVAIQEYKATNFKLALKSAFYDFTTARDFYREACLAMGTRMHRDSVIRYIELQALLLAVIAPHWAEYVWRELLRKETSIQNEHFPTIPEPDPALTWEREYMQKTASSIHSTESLQMKRKAKGKEQAFDPRQPKRLTIYTTDKFPAWQEKAIEALREAWDPEAKSVRDEKQMLASAGKILPSKKVMSFLQTLKKRLAAGEPTAQVLDRKLAFEEREALKRMMPGLTKSASLAEIKVLAVDESGKKGVDIVTGDEVEISNPSAEAAIPGAPTFYFENV